MRKIFCILGCLALTAGTGLAGELLSNGDFELDGSGTGWTHFEDPGIGWWQWAGDKDHDSTPPRRAPSWNQYIGCSGWFCDRAGVMGVSQEVVGGLQEGAGLTAAGWFYYESVAHDGDPTDAQHRIRIVFRDGVDAEIETQESGWQVHVNDDDWDYISFTGAIPVGAVKVEFIAETSDTDGQISGTEAIDELSLDMTASSVSHWSLYR